MSPTHYHPSKFLNGIWSLTCWNLKEVGFGEEIIRRKFRVGKKIMPQLYGALFTHIHPPLKVFCTTQALPREEIPHVLKEKSMLASLNFNLFIMCETSHWKTKQLCDNAVLFTKERPEST